MIKKYAVLLMLGGWIFAAPLYAQQGKGPQMFGKKAQPPFGTARSSSTLGSLSNMPDIERNLEQRAAQAAAQAQRTPRVQEAQTRTVWTCAFCGEPILHDHQKCSGEDNPFRICTHTDLNWGTPLHQGEHREGREKSIYYVPFEPAQVSVSTKTKTVWTCAFCGEPILHDHQKCSGEDNPFRICTHTDLNWGTPLHQGEHREGREKSRYNVPFEPRQVEVAPPVSSQAAPSKENK